MFCVGPGNTPPWAHRDALEVVVGQNPQFPDSNDTPVAVSGSAAPLPLYAARRFTLCFTGTPLPNTQRMRIGVGRGQEMVYAARTAMLTSTAPAAGCMPAPFATATGKV